MKVRRQLARRMAASYACAKRDAAWWLGFGLPDGQVLPLPLLGRCVWASSRVVPPQGIRPARIPFDVTVAALHAEVAAGPTLQVGPTDYHEPRP